jgi:hypothetical protein
MVAACILTLAAFGGAAWVVACQDESRNPARADHHLGPSSAAVIVETADIVAPVTTPPLRAGEAMTPTRATRGAEVRATPRASTRSAARRATAAPPSDSLPRRVARFITGDGRHEVRPFPTIDR